MSDTRSNIDKYLNAEQAWRYEVALATSDTDSLSFYVDELSSELALATKAEELSLLTGSRIAFKKIPKEQLVEKLTLYYARQDHTDQRLQNNYYSSNPDNFLSDLIAEAQQLKSSDIHVEVYENECRVRIRVDGLLVLRYLIEQKQYPALINKIKIAANLDIAEKRLPQDGRIFYERANDKFDIRVSIIPTLYGEKVVLRLLSNDAADIKLENLGFSESDLKNYKEGLRKPFGIILISGPTGSGKTTTLYATLKVLNQTTKNILTVEDPIEYTVPGINQVQVRDNIGLSFAKALRTFLRQDPDIIMLGEIRDSETANMAIRAALTGHLVLSTIHTNSAWGTISRFIDMNMPPFLIANTLNTSVAQRLVRMLCPQCKKEVPFDKKLYPSKFTPPEEVSTHYLPVGCTSCYNTGYKKRKAIYEVIPIDERLAEEIKRETSRVDDLLKEKNIKSLSSNAFELFKKGLTSLEEVYPILMG